MAPAIPRPGSPIDARGPQGRDHRDDVSDKLGGIAVPTLVIVGEEDDNPGVSASAALAAHIGGAGLTVLPDTGHLSALEQPGRFGDALLDFLAHQ